MTRTKEQVVSYVVESASPGNNKFLFFIKEITKYLYKSYGISCFKLFSKDGHMTVSRISSLLFACLGLALMLPANAAWNKEMSQADTEKLVEAHATTLSDLQNSLVLSTVVRDKQDVDAAIARLEEAEKLIPQIKVDLDAITAEYGTSVATYQLYVATSTIEAMADLRQQLSNAFVQSAQMELDSLKARHESYILSGDSTGPQDIRWALQLMPDNKDAIALEAVFEDTLSKAVEAGRAKIAEQVWPDTHAQLSEGDAGDLADSAYEWLVSSDQWGARQKNPEKILAVTIRKDWIVAKKDILGQPIQWGLPIHAAVQMPKDIDNGYARHFTLTMVTAEGAGIAKAPPWIGAWVGDSHYVLADKVSSSGGGSGSSGGSMLGTILWLALAGVNILAGIIASMPLIAARIGDKAKALDSLMATAPTIGAVSVIIGVVGIVIAILSLSPLRGIAPQLTAIVVGLFLGKEVLNRWFKPIFDFLSAKSQEGKIKPVFDKVSAMIWNPVLMGPVAFAVGIAHLILGGALYFI